MWDFSGCPTLSSRGHKVWTFSVIHLVNQQIFLKSLMCTNSPLIPIVLRSQLLWFKFSSKRKIKQEENPKIKLPGKLFDSEDDKSIWAFAKKDWIPMNLSKFLWIARFYLSRHTGPPHLPTFFASIPLRYILCPEHKVSFLPSP